MKLVFSALPNLSLPVFQAARGSQYLYYTPGLLVGIPIAEAENLNRYLVNSGRDDPQFENAADYVDWPFLKAAQMMLDAAIENEQSWKSMLDKPFKPLCLTLYPHNRCNLACSYCFSDAQHNEKNTSLSLRAVRAAAQFVFQNCISANRPMTVVFHGGGEPTFYREWVDQALGIIDQVAKPSGVKVFKYVATNGVMSKEKLAWLTNRFDMVGVSCDGPSDIHSSQRPLIDGRSSSPWVEQMAQIVKKNGKPLHVRVTITPATLRRQPEIAKYLCETIQPQEIHVETVYAKGRAKRGMIFQPKEAEVFADYFFEARQVSLSYGIPWLTSGSRLNELHGPYCHLFRSVLQMVPGNSAVACFTTCDSDHAKKEKTGIGSYNDSMDDLSIEIVHLNHLKQRLASIPDKCAPCFNRFHCTRACPDHCPLSTETLIDGFRCLLNSTIASYLLEEQALRFPNDQLWIKQIPQVMH